MKRTTYQVPELRDENDNIIQQGAFGKNTALANSTNDGWIDYVANDLNFLYDLAKDEVVPVSALPASGDMNKTYLLTTNGKTYRWSGTAWVELTNSEAVGRAENAATLAEQWATKIDGTVADNEYSAKYYANAAQQSADDAQDVADDMADHLAQIDQNTGGVSANSKRIGNIEKLLQGNLYDYQTDSTSAYTKTVPSGAMPYAGLGKVGGKTVVMNQGSTTLYTGGHTSTNNGVTYTWSNDGKTITANGTASPATSAIAVCYYVPCIKGHKYALRGCPAQTNFACYLTCTQVGTLPNPTQYFDAGNGAIFQATSDDATTVYIIARVNVNSTVNNVQFKPQLYDLTMMFGVGNEPTIEQFNAMLPTYYYTYVAPTLMSAGVTEVVSKDSNNATLQTYSIPAEIQALEGYGWSAGSVYNYVDFERKVFVKNVGKYTFTGSEKWSDAMTGAMFTLAITDALYDVGQYVVCDRYLGMVSGSNSTHTNTDKSCWLQSISSYKRFYVYDSNYDRTTIGASMVGVEVFYPLATPQETDISQYLTDDNLISVESGGTLTFPNSNGTDYQIPVPSSETYMVDLQASL